MNKDKKNSHIISVVLVLVLLAALFGGSVVVGNFVQKNPTSLKIDAYFYNLTANGPHLPIFDTLVWPINNNFLHVWGSSLPSYFVVILGLFFLYLVIFKRKVLGWALITYFIVSFLIGSIYVFDSQYIFRQRPYLTLPNTFLSDQLKKDLKGWNSFPSGHARDTVVYSVMIAYYIPALTIPMIVFSLFVGWSRLYVGAHFPTDIIVGFIMGFIIGEIALIITKEIHIIFDKIRHKNG